jgi:hypothetical protein
VLGVLVVGVAGVVVVGAGAVGVVAPGVTAPGVVAPGVAAPGVVVPGTVLSGVPAGPVATAGGAVVMVRVVAGELELEPERSTSAAVRTPSESATTARSAAIGTRQFGAAASRVRAAAPQRRHHSCSR